MRLLIASLLFCANSALCQVPLLYSEIATKTGVPAAVLYSVARGESVLRKLNQPWPWTLNVGGVALRFRTREHAQMALVSLLAAGYTNIDVGIMQINWRWNSELLGDPSIAFDPAMNIHAGAMHLKALYLARGSWRSAVGAYHSPINATRAERYATGIWAHLEGLQ